MSNLLLSLGLDSNIKRYSIPGGRRDQIKYDQHANLGWRTLVIQECVIRRQQNIDQLLASINQWIESDGSFAELPPVFSLSNPLMNY